MTIVVSKVRLEISFHQIFWKQFSAWFSWFSTWHFSGADSIFKLFWFTFFISSHWICNPLQRYVTGEVSSIVMKSDERIIEQRVRLDSVEALLKDHRIGPDLRDEIRGHFFFSQSSSVEDQSSLFRCVHSKEKSLSSLKLAYCFVYAITTQGFKVESVVQSYVP